MFDRPKNITELLRNLKVAWDADLLLNPATWATADEGGFGQGGCLDLRIEIDSAAALSLGSVRQKLQFAISGDAQSAHRTYGSDKLYVSIAPRSTGTTLRPVSSSFRSLRFMAKWALAIPSAAPPTVSDSQCALCLSRS